MKLTSKNIRNSARDQPCTVNMPYVCNNRRETTVYCHIAADGGKMGGKAEDILGGYYACSSCHDIMDMRMRITAGEEEIDRQFYEYRAVRRTWRYILTQLCEIK